MDNLLAIALAAYVGYKMGQASTVAATGGTIPLPGGAAISFPISPPAASALQNLQ
jgi:hypothetical protein